MAAWPLWALLLVARVALAAHLLRRARSGSSLAVSCVMFYGLPGSPVSSEIWVTLAMLFCKGSVCHTLASG
jgi:hypothetical protein